MTEGPAEDRELVVRKCADCGVYFTTYFPEDDTCKTCWTAFCGATVDELCTAPDADGVLSRGPSDRTV